MCFACKLEDEHATLNPDKEEIIEAKWVPLTVFKSNTGVGNEKQLSGYPVSDVVQYFVECYLNTACLGTAVNRGPRGWMYHFG